MLTHDSSPKGRAKKEGFSTVWGDRKGRPYAVFAENQSAATKKPPHPKMGRLVMDGCALV